MEENKTPSRRRSHAAAPLGGIFVVLAIIGLITVIQFTFHATERLLDNSSEKEEFERILLPVLTFDPIPFENPNELDNLVLLRASIWSALVENFDKYKPSTTNMYLIPKGDVDVACARLFGPEITLEHQSFTNYVSMYNYDKEKETYLVPMDEETMLYLPKVKEIKKDGDRLSLLVGYVATGNDWFKSFRGKDYEPAPDKYMIYQVKKVDKHYQLMAIKDPPNGAVPGQPPILPEDQVIQPPIDLQPSHPAVHPDGEEHPESDPHKDEGTAPDEDSEKDPEQSSEEDAKQDAEEQSQQDAEQSQDQSSKKEGEGSGEPSDRRAGEDSKQQNNAPEQTHKKEGPSEAL